MPNTKPTPARAAAPPPGKYGLLLDRIRPVVTHPLWIGLILCGVATLCGWSTMIVAATVANWITK